MIPPAKNEFVILGFCVSMYLFGSRAGFATESGGESMRDFYVVFHKQLGDLVLLEPSLRKLALATGGSARLLTRSGHRDLLSLFEHVSYHAGVAWRPARLLVAYDSLSKTTLRSTITPAVKKICVLPERESRRAVSRVIFRKTFGSQLGEEYLAHYFWKHTPCKGDVFEPPRLRKPPSEWRPACAPEKPYVLLNPTSGWKRKSWTPAGWAAVNAALADEGFPRVVTGGSQHWQLEQVSAFAALAGGASPILAGSTSLREFLWLCANARLVITVDGAASHLASAFGVACLTLFGPTSVANWHLPGPRSRALVAEAGEDGRRRLKTLVPERVIHAAQELMR